MDLDVNRTKEICNERFMFFKAILIIDFIYVSEILLQKLLFIIPSMEEDDFEDKLKFFSDSLINTTWMLTATEETIDKILQIAVELEEIFCQKYMKKTFFIDEFPHLNYEKSIDLLMEKLIKSQKLSDELTLYSITKCSELLSKERVCEIINFMVAEVELREHLCEIIENVPEVYSDWSSINSLIDDIEKDTSNYKIYNAIKAKTTVLLNSIRHTSVEQGYNLINQIVNCLQSQSDLKLWFILFRPEHLESILYLASKYDNFLKSILEFFNKFADEVESNYDEDLNVKYCHVNLDFEDFLKVIQSFLNDKNLHEAINEFLEKKIQLSDKNFCFWMDIKACL